MPTKKILRGWTVALVMASAVTPTTLLALPVDQIPNPRQTSENWVSDVANILQPKTEERLNALINQLKGAKGSEMAVVTLPDSQPAASTKELATKLFNTWRIGQKGKDNGILLLISVGDRRVEIETGYGMEAILPDAKVATIIEQRITPKFKSGDFDGGTLSGTEAIVQLAQGKEPEDVSATSNINSWLILFYSIFAAGISLILIVIGQTIRIHSATGWVPHLTEALQGFAGVVFVRGLGQSVKLNPRQSSRVRMWHLRFETGGSMRCATCGDILEPVDPATVASILKPSEKAAEGLGSLEFRGWRCRRCAPEAMHLRVYESPSNVFALCPHCQELTVQNDTPYVIPNPTPPGRDLRITNSHCVACDYTNQVKEFVQPWIVIEGSSSGGSDSSGGGFSGGSSGGGGAGGDW